MCVYIQIKTNKIVHGRDTLRIIHLNGVKDLRKGINNKGSSQV